MLFALGHFPAGGLRNDRLGFRSGLGLRLGRRRRWRRWGRQRLFDCLVRGGPARELRLALVECQAAAAQATLLLCEGLPLGFQLGLAPEQPLLVERHPQRPFGRGARRGETGEQPERRRRLQWHEDRSGSGGQETRRERAR